MDRFAELKAAIKTAELVDAHAHNIVAVDSAFPFLNCFSEAAGDALSYAPHTINFKVSVESEGQLIGFVFFISKNHCSVTLFHLKSISFERLHFMI